MEVFSSQQELPFSRREEFEAELNKRALSESACSILLLMFEAANGTGPPGVNAAFHSGPDPCYLMDCEYGQLALARYCGIRSDSTLRAIMDRMARLGIFQRRTSTNGCGNETVYCLRLRQLMNLPVSDTESPIGKVMEMLEQRSLNDVFGAPEGEDVRASIAKESHVVRVEKDTELQEVLTARLKEVNETNERLLMSSITDADVRLIAGFAPAEGPRRVPTEEQRLELFARYWADAKLRDQGLTSTDCVELLGLFINKGRNAPRQGKSANPRGAAVATWWRNRREQPLKNTLRKMELDEALRLLDSRRCKPAEVETEPVAVSAERVQSRQVELPKTGEPLRRLNMQDIKQRLADGARVREERMQER